jgi:hypothetical protein
LRATIFVGPSLHDHPVLRDRTFDWRPPAQLGDLYLAARAGAKMIGLIDGQFETVRSVWHKEILFALSTGVRVYGSASIGALRAVELAPYGMVGVGAIYRDFRDGRLEDDDEVALLHAAGEEGYRPLSEPMVDIRATLMAAVQQGIVSQRSAARLIAIAKDTYFKDRAWDRILSSAGRERLPKAQLLRLRRWLPENRVALKRTDAIALVEALRRQRGTRKAAVSSGITFISTIHWQRAQRRLRTPQPVGGRR